MHNMKSIMVQLKCSDCGQLFSAWQPTCPNCGCSAETCIVSEESLTDDDTLDEPQDTDTNDTGYANEKTITTYANVICALAILLGFAGWIGGFFILIDLYGGEGFAINFFFGGILLVIYILLAKVWRAFITVFANISINLHELNMKNKTNHAN